MKLSNSKIKKFLIISQKKAFLIFSQKAPPPTLSSLSPQKPALKKFLIPPVFWKQKSQKTPYVSGNKTLLYFGK